MGSPGLQMGTPSGSKNCNILQDRLDFLAAQFERPVYDTSHIESDGSNSAGLERKAERELKKSEVQEFRLAASGSKIDKKIGRLEQLTKKPLQPVGPANEKRKLPGFVKLKSREIANEGPEVKRQCMV